MRPTLRATRIAGRRMNSSSAPQVNPQVQKAVEAASKAYAQSAATVKRVAGPVGEKIGGALGGMSGSEQGCAHLGLHEHRLRRLAMQRDQTRQPTSKQHALTDRLQRTLGPQLQGLCFALSTGLQGREDGTPNHIERMGQRILGHLEQGNKRRMVEGSFANWRMGRSRHCRESPT
jgi:hypothetical protein